MKYEIKVSLIVIDETNHSSFVSGTSKVYETENVEEAVDVFDQIEKEVWASRT